jgi:hypothetical protein
MNTIWLENEGGEMYKKANGFRENIGEVLFLEITRKGAIKNIRIRGKL